MSNSPACAFVFRFKRSSMRKPERERELMFVKSDFWKGQLFILTCTRLCLLLASMYFPAAEADGEMWVSTLLAGCCQRVTVCRYHFTSWLFSSVLKDYTDLCPFLRSHLSFNALNSKPVVHCTHGTHRSWCFFFVFSPSRTSALNNWFSGLLCGYLFAEYN